MSSHINRNMNETFSCIQCKNDFNSNTGLKEHLKTAHHDKKPNECFCGIQYKSSYTLKTHIKNVHSNQPRERSFICVTCNKGKIMKNVFCLFY